MEKAKRTVGIKDCTPALCMLAGNVFDKAFQVTRCIVFRR
jgi:hypothetical protein